MLLALTLLAWAGPASSQAQGDRPTSVVKVLCADSLPQGLPGCQEVAEALSVEVEEFSMTAVTGPAPWEMVLWEVSGPGVSFVVWMTPALEGVVMHVYETSTETELTRVLTEADLEAMPTAADLAILFKNLMGTSLYADLASIEDDELLMDLAVPEDKEKIILEKAIKAGKVGKSGMEQTGPAWMPQFSMGWSLLSHPDINNTSRGYSDMYNGLLLAVRFPIEKRWFAGASVALTQSLKDSFENQISPVPLNTVTEASFIEDQLSITLNGAWYALQTRRVGIWVGLGPGIVRSSLRLVVVDKEFDAATGSSVLQKVEANYAVWRMSLGTSAGFQLNIVPRVKLEGGLGLHYLFNLVGAKNFTFRYESTDSTVENHRYFQHGNVRINFWIAMVFG